MSAFPALADDNDLTAHLEVLGNPLANTYKDGEFIYARNIWDLQAFEGRLYLGAGNSSNSGPASNAGPVPIISFDPVTGKFSEEFIVDDEQIDVYYVFDGQLYTPGHDPTESWLAGNFYRRGRDGEWQKHRSLSQVVHAYAMTEWNGKLLVGVAMIKSDQGSPNSSYSGVGLSTDNGATWRMLETYGARTYSFLEVSGDVYAIDQCLSPQAAEIIAKSYKKTVVAVSQFNGVDAFEPRKDLVRRLIFPSSTFRPNVAAKVARPTRFRERAVYIGAYRHNDHQSLPFGVFVASSLERDNVKVVKADLPEEDLARDIMVRDDVVYVLLDSGGVDPRLNRVAVSRDLENWVELFRFTSDTFARSFELLNGDFYFGLGCEVDDPHSWQQEELHAATGQILRLIGKYFTKQ
jgi:hypothetical protein